MEYVVFCIRIWACESDSVLLLFYFTRIFFAVLIVMSKDETESKIVNYRKFALSFKFVFWFFVKKKISLFSRQCSCHSDGTWQSSKWKNMIVSNFLIYLFSVSCSGNSRERDNHTNRTACEIVWKLRKRNEQRSGLCYVDAWNSIHINSLSFSATFRSFQTFFLLFLGKRDFRRHFSLPFDCFEIVREECNENTVRELEKISKINVILLAFLFGW